MSGNENVSNQQYPGSAYNKGHQGGHQGRQQGRGGADFFNTLPQPPPFSQPQVAPSQHTPYSSMNPAFQPQGPPVFYNPMDYQKPAGNTLPITNHQETPWQPGPHPPNGVDNNGYSNPGWNQSGGFANHYANDSANHGHSLYGDERHHDVAGHQGWHGNQGDGMHPHYPDQGRYHNPQADHPEINYQQQFEPGNPLGGEFQPGYQPNPHPSQVPNAEADNESVSSSGGGLSGFFHDRDEDDVDLVNPKGKDSVVDRNNPNKGLSGPDIIPAASQDSSLEHTKPELPLNNLIEGIPGGLAESHVGSLPPDLGQRPHGHGDISQQPQPHMYAFGQGNSQEFGLRTDLDLNSSPSEPHLNLGPSGPQQDPGGSGFGIGHHNPASPLAGDGALRTAEVPPLGGGVGDGAIPQSADTAGMPEIVKQSSLVNPSEGQGFGGRPRTQSSDLISDIEDSSKAAYMEGQPPPARDDASETPSVRPNPPHSVTPGSGDPSEHLPADSPRGLISDDDNRTESHPSGVVGGVMESHPDLSASVPSAGQISKPDITNVNSSDKPTVSPLGPSSLTTTLPTLSDLDTSHTSAFRSISGRHTPKQTSAVNPSPPLWSTGVPSTAGNILLAPALSQPSIMPVLHPSPVKLQPKSQSSMSQPGPMPLRATADALGPGSQSGIPVSNVAPLTQQMGAMQIAPGDTSGLPTTGGTEQTQQPPTSQPTFDFGKPYHTLSSTASSLMAPQPSSQGEVVTSQESVVGTGIPTSGAPSGPDEGLHQQPSSQPGYPAQNPGGPGGPSHLQQQYPPHYGAYSQGQGHRAYDPRYGGYPGGWDRYGRQGYGTRYDAAGRPIPPEQYPPQQYGRQSPYRQGADRSGGWNDYARTPSRQGSERPQSRQGWAGGEYPENYNYQRWPKDREEYRRDDYYRQWYHQQRGGWPKWWRADDYRWYYEKARAQQAKNWTREGDQSGEWRSQSEEMGKDGGNKTEDSFTSEFHHAGGGTPDKYGADQSRIQDGGYHQQQQSMDQSGMGYGAQTGGDGSYRQQDYNSYSQEYSSFTEETQTVSPPPQERMTPTKFGIAHVVARFSPGGHLIKVLPNTPADGMPARVEIHRVEDMLEESQEAIELKAFPGPLIRGETHKSDVIAFATRKSREATSSTDLADRDSVALLWELMELLCRQNGSVLETDISELLLQDHTAVTEEEDSDGEESSQQRIPARNKQKDTVQFRKLLLYGRKKESLEYAMKAGLWGHALLLAGKMDARTHASVMTRFANSLDMNDPLQTLYQLMSDRQPAAVTSCTDEKWGDWRPHLAMILSNLRSSDSELGIKSITALGDSLATRGLLHASHFCYLMAQVGLGPYTHKATKIVLLGSSHRLQFNEFATNMSIQLTEVYEYAQLLGNKHYLLPNFQAYKFLHATRLAEHGMLEQALRYCEVIAGSIQYKPEQYSLTLVEQVCELANRLKHHDTQYYDGLQLTEPQWLMTLQGILAQMKDGTIQPPSKSDTPMPWTESYSNLSTIGGDSNEDQTPSTDGQPSYPPVDYHQSYQDQSGSNQYYNNNQQWGYQNYQEQGTGEQTEEGGEPTPTSDAGQGFTYNQDVSQQQVPYNANQQWQGQQYVAEQNQQYQGEVNLAASANSNFSEYSTTTGTETCGDTTDYGESMTSQAGFDYYRQSTQRSRADTADTITAPTHRQRTQSGSTHQSRSRTVSGSSNRSEGRPKEVSKDGSKESAQAPGAGGAGGGWFSGLFNKLRSKNGKEIHLPDDNSQSIVWDSEKKKWVNTLGGDDDDSVPQGPPPSDMELIKQQAGPSAGPGGLAPPVGVNKFSRKTNAARYVDVLNNDSSAPSVPTPSSLLPPIQSATTAPVNFYIPEAAPDTNEANTQQQQPQQQQQQHVGNPDSEPPTPNNTQAAAPQQLSVPQQDNLSHSSSRSSLSEEVSHLTSQSIKEAPQTSTAPSATAAAAPPPLGAPLMFNPSQMAQPASFPAPGGTNKPSRYGARRQYPR
ncbi:uncharacterized protein [Apostichopus japonicus]|uniref:uncharacterized protein isoform X5 n=1 Tax=Stichopus japonicus TaxID=307972 RepID=UPI003AB7F77A